MESARTDRPLSSGVTAVLTEGRSTIHHRLTLTQQAASPGQVLWVDARDTASTYLLYDLATDRRLLDGVSIARAWTAYQHYTLVTQLVARVTPRTRLLVLPNVCSLYRDDDVRDPMATKLLTATLTTLAELATAASLPVLLTAGTEEQSTVAPYATTVRTASDVIRQSMLPPTSSTASSWIQSTIPYWLEHADTHLAFADRYRVSPVQQRLNVDSPTC